MVSASVVKLGSWLAAGGLSPAVLFLETVDDSFQHGFGRGTQMLMGTAAQAAGSKTPGDSGTNLPATGSAYDQ